MATLTDAHRLIEHDFSLLMGDRPLLHHSVRVEWALLSLSGGPMGQRARERERGWLKDHYHCLGLRLAVLGLEEEKQAGNSLGLGDCQWT